MDFITEFMDHTKTITSPEIFRLWTAISSVAVAVERRVYFPNPSGLIFPNVFVMLVADPGVGKGQSIDMGVKLWRRVGSLNKLPSSRIAVAPKSMTKAAMLDRLKLAGKTIVTSKDSILQYHSLAIGTEEFSTLLSTYDLEMLSFLTEGYNCAPRLDEARRMEGASTDIINPQLNMLVGAQPGFLSAFLPEVAFEQGFMSRMIMVHSSEEVEWNIFAEYTNAATGETQLVRRLEQITTLTGPIRPSDDFKLAFIDWQDDGFRPVPTHNKLRHYCIRRRMHVMKLSIISALSQGNNTSIELEDFARAKSWLLAAERTMPGIFQHMSSKSDIDLIRELAAFVKTRGKDRAMTKEADIYQFLASRAPSERIARIISIAEKSGEIKSVGQGLYLPKPS